MSVEGLLQRGLEVIHRSGSHSTGALARDAHGERVAPNSPHAVKWDAFGILLHITNAERFVVGSDAERASELLTAAAQEMGYPSAHRASDEGGKNAVESMYRRALARLDLPGPPTSAQIPEGSTTP